MIKTITLATVREFPRAITAQAIRCGRFAVHRPDGGPLNGMLAGSSYTITHVATGYQAGTVQGKGKALARAKALDRALGDEDFTVADFEPQWSDRYRAWVEKAKELAR